MARDPVISVRLHPAELSKLEALRRALDRLASAEVSRSDVVRWLLAKAPTPPPPSLPRCRSLGA